MSDFMSDLKGVFVNQTLETMTAKNSTNKKAGADLEMTDFLQLMVATFQNQSIDDVASTSDMMNQMVQMSVINAISNLNTLVSETTGLSYAASLVGKEVTIGQYFGRELTTITGTVTGTGTLNGQHVIFIDDKSYWLSDVMAVGKIPENAELPSTDAASTIKEATDTRNNTTGNDAAVTRPGQNVTVDEPEPIDEQEALEDIEQPGETEQGAEAGSDLADNDPLVENGADVAPETLHIGDADNGEDEVALDPADGSENAKEQEQEEHSQVAQNGEYTAEVPEITPEEVIEQAAEDIYENSI